MEYVDLGLPSGNLWAKCNIGANSEDEAGLYFQWGDTQGYTAEQVGKDKQFDSDYSDYKFGSSTNLSKYNSSDGKIILDLEDDAAYVILGEGWRMPTMDDFVELCKETDMFVVSAEGEEVPITINENSDYPIYFEFDAMDRAKAFKFYNKKDHSFYISIPFVGSAYDGSVRYVEEDCCLWSSSLGSEDVVGAFNLGCFAPYGFGYVFDEYNFAGLPIRPIRGSLI